MVNIDVKYNKDMDTVQVSTKSDIVKILTINNGSKDVPGGIVNVSMAVPLSELLKDISIPDLIALKTNSPVSLQDSQMLNTFLKGMELL